MRFATIAAFAAAALLAVGPVRAQTPTQPPAENLAAARELVQTLKSTDQFRAILPTIFDNLRPVFVQDRPEMGKDYDAIIPIVIASATKRVDEFADKLAAIYANNFTVSELRDLIAFYRTPTGQKFIARQQDIARASMAMGQEFGQTLVKDLREQITEELRKREKAK
jgi:hypothetical protein